MLMLLISVSSCFHVLTIWGCQVSVSLLQVVIVLLMQMIFTVTMNKYGNKSNNRAMKWQCPYKYAPHVLEQCVFLSVNARSVNACNPGIGITDSVVLQKYKQTTGLMFLLTHTQLFLLWVGLHIYRHCGFPHTGALHTRFNRTKTSIVDVSHALP